MDHNTVNKLRDRDGAEVGLPPWLGLCAATEEELDAVGMAGSACLVTGMGPARTSMTVTRLLERTPGLRALVMVGIGGAFFEAGLALGDVVVASSESFGDLARCGNGGLSTIEVPGNDDPMVFDLQEDLGHWLGPEDLARLGVSACAFTTVCCVSDDPARAAAVRAFTGAALENMEGAAACMVCREYGVDFLELRAVSNIAGTEDRSAWDIPGALGALSRVIPRVLKAIEARGPR